MDLAGNPVILNFELDLNGLPKVTDLEKDIKPAKSVTVDPRGKGSAVNF